MRPERIASVALLWLAAAFAPPAAAAGDDVVFLLGEDKRGNSPYFSVAAEYYRRSSPDARIVASLRSLAEVREYLVRHRGDDAWHEVILVDHGAPWMGMHATVFPNGARASLEAVQAAQRDGLFPPMPAGVFDAGTTLRLESCGLGRRPDFIAAVAALFGGDGGPRVEASEQFVAYRVDADQAVRFEVPFASAVVSSSTVADPSAHALAVADLRRQLQDATGADASDAVLQTLPISIDIDFADPLPREPARRRMRIARDPAVLARLQSYGLQPRDLRWQDATPAAGAAARIEGSAALLVLRSRPVDDIR